MSQWVKAKSEVLANVEKNILALACEELNLKYDDTIKSISNSWGKDTVDAGVKKNNKVMDFGFKFTENEFGEISAEVTGDFYFSDFKNSKDFVDKLSKQYRRHDIEQKAAMNGYQLESVNETQNGQIEMVLFAY